MSFNARQSAIDILNALDKGHRTLDNILTDYCGIISLGARQDRALFQALVYGVLRWRGRLDYMISHFSNTRFDKINPSVLNILRLALFQIIYMDRIPHSAAVNTAVELAKASAAPWVVGYVNALLRKAAREYRNVSFPDLKQNTVAALAVQKSFPEWMIRKWLPRYGHNTTALLCDSLNAIPPLTIRTNTLKISPGQLIAALINEAQQIKPTPYSPDGITFFSPVRSIAELHAFKAGWFQVQDEAAQLVSLLLDPQPDDRVLDVCAGLGGKTGHIAQLMHNEGSLVASDINETKLERLQAEMQRLDISILSTFSHNYERALTQDKLPAFDRVLLDAPCSGMGVMRRNPDIKWQSSKKDLRHYQTRQLRLLENSSRLLKLGGILVYAVCSLEPEETEEVVNQFLKNHDEFVIDREYGRLPVKLCAMADQPGVFKTWPQLKQMDGFYSIRLQRIS